MEWSYLGNWPYFLIFGTKVNSKMYLITYLEAEVKQPAVQIKKAKKRELVGQTYTICNF